MAEPRRGQLSAWLQKKKSGSSALRLRQYNKRFFTLDFDARSFYYTHSEGKSQKVSSEIPFGELMDVRPADSQVQQGDDASVCSKQSKVSLLKRMSTLTSSKKEEEQEQHVLSVLTKPDKRIELMCSSAAEATEWYEAFKLAIMTGGGDASSIGVSGMKAGGYPQGGGGPPTAPPGAGVTSDTDSPKSNEGAGVGNAIAAAVSLSSAPARRNFLDFEAIEEEVRPGEESAKAAKAAGKAVPDSTEVSKTGIMTMQATDFGFAADDQGSSASSSAPGSPRGGGGGAAGGTSGSAAGSRVDSARGAPAASDSADDPTSPGAGARAVYNDRHEGKTLQERLANLEFSDEEDEDDDPFGKGGNG